MFIIAIISIAIYLIAILMVSTNIYEFQKEQKLNFIIIGVFAILILTWIIVAFSSNSIQVSEEKFLKTAKEQISWQIPNVVPADSCTEPPAFKPRTVGLYAPLRVTFKRKRAVHGTLWNCQPINKNFSQQKMGSPPVLMFTYSIF